MTALWTTNAIEAATRGVGAGPLPQAITGISIDSRTVAAGEAFFAIKGDIHDGHDFVAAALAAGAALAVVARNRSRSSDAFGDDAPLIVVDDVLEALRDLAAAARGALGRQNRGGDRIGREDLDQGGAGSRARCQRRNPCVGGVVQQSLGRAVVAGPDGAVGALRRVRDRHEPCRRNHAADAHGAPACGDRHRGRAGASRILCLRRRHRRRQGGNLSRR